jgi:hypothetical protein
MLTKLTGLSAYILVLFLVGCNNDNNKWIITNQYNTRNATTDLTIDVHEDSLSLDVPTTLMGYDSVLLYFPASKAEIRGYGEQGEYFNKYQFKPKGINRLFKLNDSIQVILKKKNMVVYRSTLYKFIDSIPPGSSGMLKLC